MTVNNRGKRPATVGSNSTEHDYNRPSLVGRPALWRDPIAQSNQLANVMLFAPIGFKGEHRETAGASHLVEHLIATGDDGGPHFNGLTSDSVIAIYGLCSSDEVDGIVSTLAARARPDWVRDTHVMREANSVLNETAHHEHRSTRFDHLIAGIGLNAGAGELNERPNLSAIREMMNAVSSRATIGIFDPYRHTTMNLQSLGDTGPAVLASPHLAVRRERTRSDALTVWRFNADTVAGDARFQLAVDFALLDGYLRKRGGSARVAWLDDFRWWGGDTWAAMAVPEVTRSLLEQNGLRTVGDLVDRIRRTNPGLTEQARKTIAYGPTWIRHPVVREIVTEMSSALLNKIPPVAADTSSWVRNTGIVEA